MWSICHVCSEAPTELPTETVVNETKKREIDSYEQRITSLEIMNNTMQKTIENFQNITNSFKINLDSIQATISNLNILNNSTELLEKVSNENKEVLGKMEGITTDIRNLHQVDVNNEATVQSLLREIDRIDNMTKQLYGKTL